jgi:two-component system chemotaxis response regulator CheY
MAVDKSIAILMVDDSTTMISIVKNLLRQIGFENVDEVLSGAAALEKLAQKEYQLVISDWNMEPMTGFELLKRMRSIYRYQEMPFIMMTSAGSSENVIAAKFAGVSGYIIKPFTGENLKQKIDYVFNEKPAVARVDRVVA